MDTDENKENAPIEFTPPKKDFGKIKDVQISKVKKTTPTYNCERFKMTYNALDVWNTYAPLNNKLYLRGQDWRAESCPSCGGERFTVCMRKGGGGMFKCFTEKCDVGGDSIALAKLLTGNGTREILKDARAGKIYKV